MKSWRPLLHLIFPVSESFGGGKSGFRRINSHLQTFLIGSSPKIRKQVAHLFFASRDDVPRRCLVDRVSDFAEHLLHLLTHLLDVLISRQCRLGFHGKVLLGKRSLAYLYQTTPPAPGKFAAHRQQLAEIHRGVPAVFRYHVVLVISAGAITTSNGHEPMTGTFRQRLRAGETLLGTFITLPTAAIAEIVAEVGFDWLFIDGEHSPFDTGDIVAMLQAVGDRVACVVRVPGAEEAPIKKILDQGAEGIIVPQVNTVDQAAAVVRYARYAPSGSRGVGLSRAQGYGLRFQEYLQTANDHVAVIVQAEHARAVENIESIVKVEGIDAVLVGPYDLAASLGKMGQIDDPEVTAAIEHVAKTCQAAGIPLGYFGTSAAALRPVMDRGFTLITAGVDVLFLAGAARALLEELRGT